MLAQMTAPTNQPRLVGAEDCILILFPCENSRPGLRTWRQWQSNGFLPYVRIGRRIYFDPEQVRAALERRFRINPTETL